MAEPEPQVVEVRPLTAKQQRLYDFFVEYHARHGFFPTRKEAHQALAIKHVTSMTNLINAITRKGWWTRPKNVHRMVVLTAWTQQGRRPERALVWAPEGSRPPPKKPPRPPKNKKVKVVVLGRGVRVELPRQPMSRRDAEELYGQLTRYLAMAPGPLAESGDGA